MTDILREAVRKIVLDTIRQEVDIKNGDIRSFVFEQINDRVNKHIDQVLDSKRLDQYVDQAVARVVDKAFSGYASRQLHSMIESRAREVAASAEITITIK